MFGSVREHLQTQLAETRAAGLYKEERTITSPQGAHIAVGGRKVLNLCANNYLGLASHPEVAQAARDALDRWGYGLSSVRFICGTQTIHKDLEKAISDFLGTEDTLLYSSCFDANGGLFETLLGGEDAVLSDELNHASIIDGIRLSKARRGRFKHGDLADLEGICRLAERYEALVMIDDSHAVGFLGRTGRGTHEHRGVMGRVDIITGTLGKALGGASGGYTSGRREIIELLRQRSRPYLFSNTLAPMIAAASIKAIELVSRSTERRDRLMENARYFRAGMAARGFNIRPGEHPIVPIMLGEAVLAQKVAARLLEKGVYVIGFFYPVVPQGAARIRVQISAAHTKEDLDFGMTAFSEVKQEVGFR